MWAGAYQSTWQNIPQDLHLHVWTVILGKRKNSKAVLLNPRATDRVGVIGQSPVNREGISNEKPGRWQSFRNIAGYRNRAAV